MKNLKETILVGLASRRARGIHELGDDRYIASILIDQVPEIKDLNRIDATNLICKLKLPISLAYVNHVYFSIKGF